MCKTIVLCLAFTSELLHCQAGGDAGHGHAAPAPVVPKNHLVAWAIPGSHAHGNGTMESHGSTGFEVGVDKTLKVNTKDNVTFKWTGAMMHDIQEMKSMAHLKACNFTGATSLMAKGANKTYMLPTGVAKTFYLSCSVPGHCAGKQVVIVEVTTPKASASAGFVMLPAFGLLAVLATIGA